MPYRWTIAASILLVTLSAQLQAAEEYQPLFNGKDLEGWVAEGVTQREQDGAKQPVWTVKDGAIYCQGQGFGFLRYDRREFSDFEFHLEFRMAPGCNSGLGIRTRNFEPDKSRATRPSFYSYEIQLMDDAGKAPTAHSTGSLYRYVAPKENSIKPAREWNQIDIACKGSRIKITLNGVEIIDVDQSEIAALKDKPLKGYVCLQNHGGTIEFRDIRIRALDSSK
ncbi:3-keto-disaccharide hydrolase [Singulisphaera sp. PoT]|uniref:3-keto-disaccharide hydrolase n=1 Tax=Singulisphaera sp. PoT TaxID=3411797 RepID=UPI003BF5AA16